MHERLKIVKVKMEMNIQNNEMLIILVILTLVKSLKILKKKKKSKIVMKWIQSTMEKKNKVLMLMTQKCHKKKGKPFPTYLWDDVEAIECTEIPKDINGF